MNDDNNNQEVINCDDGEYRIYCRICDKSSIKSFFRNYLKSSTHFNIKRKRQNSNNTITSN